MKTLLILVSLFFVYSGPLMATDGDKIVEIASKYTYVRENKGPNRSKDIDEWNKFTNVDLGSPYCASFISAMHKKAGVPSVISAWAPSMVPSSNRVQFDSIKRGDVGGIYFPSKSRIGHVFLVDKVDKKYVYTVEANTSGDAAYGSDKDRDGSGVFKKMRSVKLMSDSRNKFARFWKK